MYHSIVDDTELLERAQAGDSAAFGLLAERHQPAAFRLACVIAGNPSEAEDVTQDALLKAYLALPRFKPDAPFRPWLLQIVANEARNRRRSRGRRAHLMSRVADAQVADDLAAPSPEVAILADEQRRALAAEVAALCDEDRVVIAGRYFSDLRERELAELLGCPPGTVKSRLSRGLGRLRRRLTTGGALALLLLLAALIGGVLAWPGARDAIADRLGLRGAIIRHDSTVPYVAPLGLGDAVPPAIAVQRFGRPLLLPSALGPPQAMYAQSGEVWLAYAPRDGLPPAPETPGLALLLTEFNRADLEPTFLAKSLPPSTSIQDVVVAGGHGLWIEGTPHVFFRTGGGAVSDAPPRLAGNTLLWEQAGLTLRIESVLDRQSAIRIAESIGESE